MCIGINSEKKLVEDVSLQNNSNNYDYNNLNINFSINKIANFYTTIETDHKKFINKQNAINHIRYDKSLRFLMTNRHN